MSLKTGDCQLVGIFRKEKWSPAWWHQQQLTRHFLTYITTQTILLADSSSCLVWQSIYTITVLSLLVLKVSRALHSIFFGRRGSWGNKSILFSIEPKLNLYHSVTPSILLKLFFLFNLLSIFYRDEYFALVWILLYWYQIKVNFVILCICISDLD